VLLPFRPACKCLGGLAGARKSAVDFARAVFWTPGVILNRLIAVGPIRRWSLQAGNGAMLGAVNSAIHTSGGCLVEELGRSGSRVQLSRRSYRSLLRIPAAAQLGEFTVNSESYFRASFERSASYVRELPEKC